MASRSGLNGSAAVVANRATPHSQVNFAQLQRRESLSAFQDDEYRPLTAPGDRGGGNGRILPPSNPPTEQLDAGRQQKPLLLRSKSDYRMRAEEDEVSDEETFNWGARHGFEDHYQSEDVISHLANVSSSRPRPGCACPLSPRPSSFLHLEFRFRSQQRPS